MEKVITKLGSLFTYINRSLWDSLFPQVQLPDPVLYKVHIHDDKQRAIRTKQFDSLQEAMSWVNDMELMYSTKEKVFLEYVKGETNSLIELNIFSNNVYEKRSTVYRGKKEHQVVLQ